MEKKIQIATLYFKLSIEIPCKDAPGSSYDVETSQMLKTMIHTNWCWMEYPRIIEYYPN